MKEKRKMKFDPPHTHFILKLNKNALFSTEDPVNWIRPISWSGENKTSKSQRLSHEGALLYSAGYSITEGPYQNAIIAIKMA